MHIMAPAFFACLLWSTAFVGVKVGLEDASPLRFAGVRFILSGLFLLPFWRNYKESVGMLRKHFKIVAVIGFFQIFLLYALFYWGMNRVPGATGAVIIGSAPLMTALIARVGPEKETLSSKKLVSILIGVLGILLMTFDRNPFRLDGLGELMGILLLMLSMVASAIGNILVSNNKFKVNAIALNSCQIFLGGVGLLLLSFILEPDGDIPWTPKFTLILIYLSFMSATAFSLWFYVLKMSDVKVSEINIWKFVIPVCGALLSWGLMPSEVPTRLSLLGMVIVGGSVIALYLPARKM